MGDFAKEFFWKSVGDFRAWFGVAGLAIAGIKGMTGWQWIPPSWIWLLLAFGCTVWIAWRAERKIFDEKHAKIEPDTPLATAVARIIGTADLSGPGNPERTDKALLELAERAHLGTIKVWARKNVERKYDYGRVPKTEIPPSYWEEFAIEYLAVVKDARGKTWRARGTPKSIRVESGLTYGNFREQIPDTIYSDLYFSRAQIDKLWPKPRASIVWQWPFRRLPSATQER